MEWRTLNLSAGLVNVSKHHSCPLGFGYYGVVDVCIFETIVIVLLTFLIIAGNLTVIFVFHCAPLLHHYTTSYFIQTMAYADLFVGVSCLVPTLSLLHYSTGVHESLTCQVFGYHFSLEKCFYGMSCLHQCGSLSCNNQASFLQSTGHPLSPESLHRFDLDLLLPNFLTFLFWLGETWFPW